VFNINFHLIEYAINTILRSKTKNFFIVTIFSLLIFFLASILFISNSIKYELNQTVDAIPQIIVQNVKGGKYYDIQTVIADEILEISGVDDAIPRVWGYYYFQRAGVNFSLIGINSYETQYKSSLNKVASLYEFNKNSMVIGAGVRKILQDNYYRDYFNFIKPNGKLKKIKIAGIFKNATNLESNDIIIMSQENLREIFDIKENRATDIVVKINNPLEVSTIASKIKRKYPNMRVVTNEDIKISYENIFDYKSGIFLLLFTISLFTFFMIIYDRVSGTSSQEKQEIGVLKAVGWKIDDILKEKFIEGALISFLAYIIGILLSIIYVYMLQAPIIRLIFEGFSPLRTTFNLPFVLDVSTMTLIFLVTVPIYISATIFPSWRIATLDPDEILK